MIWVEFLRRENRFLILCRRGKKNIHAYLPNSGRLTDVLVRGVPILVQSTPQTKVGFRAVAAKIPSGILVSLDAHLPNRQFERLMPFCFPSHSISRRNPRLGRSILDFSLRSSDGEEIMVELKSCTLVKDGVALFPDGVTSRGTRQLHDMAAYISKGGKAALCMVVQREDGRMFAPNAEVDPLFADAFQNAINHGLQFLLLVCRFDGRLLNPLFSAAQERLILPPPHTNSKIQERQR